MKKTLQIFTALFLFSCSVWAEKSTQFISLNLCADRLLLELARPEQIAAQSPYSQNPLMMLDKINIDKPKVEPQLNQLLFYLDKTMLINTQFYPQLVKQLKQLGVNVIAIDEPQTSEQLFALLLQLGELTGNQAKAERLVTQLKSQHFSLNLPFTKTLILSETGVIEGHSPPYQLLLNLLGLIPLKTPLTQQNFSLEKLLLSQPNVLISITDKQGYNEQVELLRHPLLQKIFQHKPVASIPLKYTYCVDHGIWQGAEHVYKQIK